MSTVYKFSNKEIALIVGSLPLPLLFTFALDCHQMKAVMTLLKCATTCQRVYNYRNYHLLRGLQGGFHVGDFFNVTLIIFVYVNKTSLWAIQKVVLVILKVDVLFFVSGFTKTAWALATKFFLRKMNRKKGSVVTAKYIHIIFLFQPLFFHFRIENLNLWNFFVFFGKLIDGFSSIMNYTLYFYREHFYKQRQAEIGKKSSKC